MQTKKPRRKRRIKPLPPRLSYTTQEVADYLGIRRQAVLALVRQGVIFPKETCTKPQGGGRMFLFGEQTLEIVRGVIEKRKALRYFCVRGHPREGNTYIYYKKDGSIDKRCKYCLRITQREWLARHGKRERAKSRSQSLRINQDVPELLGPDESPRTSTE